MEKVKIAIINEVSDDDFDALIVEAINNSLKYENIGAPVDVSVTITDKDSIRLLNKEHRDIDKATDVLSFPLVDYDDGDKNDIISENAINIGYETTLLGDIVLCLDVAKQQAEEYGHSLDREIAFLTVHSMLHLLGYDHIVEEEELDMRKRQREIIELIDPKLSIKN